jgi:hypothetical protein
MYVAVGPSHFNLPKQAGEFDPAGASSIVEFQAHRGSDQVIRPCPCHDSLHSVFPSITKPWERPTGNDLVIAIFSRGAQPVD